MMSRLQNSNFTQPSPIRSLLIAIALGGIASSALFSSLEMKPQAGSDASSTAPIELLTRAADPSTLQPDAPASLDESSSSNPSQPVPSLTQQAQLQKMQYVWGQLSVPQRSSASAPSFSALERAWFSWYRWWLMHAPRSAQ
jgi:hypothetical protein